MFGGGSSGGERPDGPSGEVAEPVATGGWGVLLETYSGPNHRAIATSAAASLAGQMGRSDLRVRSTDDGSAVIAGRFDGPDDPEAKRAISQVRAFNAGGVQPFRFAFLVPPLESERDVRFPEYRLTDARDRFGPDAEWTLRVEFYDDRDRARARRVAEDRTHELRQQGETAFYYHGPQTSLITVGSFGDQDFEPATGWMSPRLRALRQRFPNTLLNGATYRIRGSQTDVPSQLTRLPDE